GLTKELYHYQSLQRGYKSTVEPIAHFGLGMADKVASVEIVWPDGKTEKVQNPSIDQVLTLAYAGAKEPSENQAASQMAFIQPVKAEAIGLAHTHRDPDFVDFNLQGLLAHKHSQNGPAMAVGDVDGNGLDDLWLGAAKGDTAVLFMQVQPGKFRQKAFSVDEAGQEDMGGLWFDLENDGDLDLYVVSGGSEKRSDEAYYQDRLYVNDGRGNFQKRSDLLPELRSSGAAVSAADLDQDGDLDLFVSGRVVPWKYPTAPQHLLLRNDNGKLTDATAELAADVQEAGMITSALWTDFNGDSRPDLILAGEWTSLQFYANQNGKLVDVTETSGVSELSGWWNSLLATDFDADGDMDYVAGNLGLNSKYKASTEEPVCLYAKDFDKNGSIDPLLCHYIQGEEYATHSLDALHAQLVSTRQRYIYYADYGRTKAKELFPKQEWEGVEVFKATHFASTYFENLGNGRFKATALPIEAQIAPVYGMLSRDLNADGHPDLLLVGNSYASETQSGWYDASIGLALLNDGQGHFSPLSANESGFFVPGDAKSLVEIVTGEENSLILAAENRGPLRAFSPATKGQLRLSQQESLAVMYLADGGKRKLEIPFGSGYLSQSSRMLSLPEGVEKVELFDTKGEKIGELKP
ncbi:MAG: FG-GAP-like repeat-containing protein, partial [Bacteroidota bacterium]